MKAKLNCALSLKPFAIQAAPRILEEILQVSIIGRRQFPNRFRWKFPLFHLLILGTNSIPIYKGPPLNRERTACEVIIPIYIHIDTLRVPEKSLRDRYRWCVCVCERAFVIACEGTKHDSLTCCKVITKCAYTPASWSFWQTRRELRVFYWNVNQVGIPTHSSTRRDSTGC